MAQPSEILNAQQRAHLLIAELAKALPPFVPPAKPALPRWLIASMRWAALVFVVMVLAIMGAGVFAAWRWAWGVGG